MLPKAKEEQLKALLKGVDFKKLTEAITAAEEVDVDIPDDLSVMTTAELALRDTNVSTKAKKEGESIGETKGKELAAKAFRKKFNLPDSVGVDIDKVVDEVNVQLNKGDVGLQQQVSKLIADKQELEATLQKKNQHISELQFDGQLVGMFPANRTADLSDSDRLLLIKNKIEFVSENGRVVAKDKNTGQIFEDETTHAPLAVPKVLENLFTERKWIGDAGTGGASGGGEGRGGGSSKTTGGASIKTLSAFTEKWKAENAGKNPVGPEFDADLQKHTKEIPDFVFD